MSRTRCWAGRERTHALGCLKDAGGKGSFLLQLYTENLLYMHPKNQFKKLFCTARGSQTAQPESELVLGHLWGKKVRAVVLELFLKLSLSCTEVRSASCSPLLRLLLRVFYKQESFLSIWKTEFTPY